MKMMQVNNGKSSVLVHPSAWAAGDYNDAACRASGGYRNCYDLLVARPAAAVFPKR
jgi:hypothetical protein